MEMEWQTSLRQNLSTKKAEITARLERITENIRRGLVPDSEEQAKQLADREVVDALGNEAREELLKISVVLERMDSGHYDICSECSDPITLARLRANPYAIKCIDCAEIDEEISAHAR